MDEEKPKLNIYQRLDLVRQAVDYVKKDAKVQTYKAVTHDAVTSEVRPHLIKHGVMIVPRQAIGRVVDSGSTTASGISIIRYEAFYEIDFVNIDQPDDIVTVPIESHALDHGDKAPGKAISYATKYAILKLLSIETGESDEARDPQSAKVKIDAKVKKELHKQTLEALQENDKVKLDEAWADFDADEKVILWGMFNSQERSAMKKLQADG